MAVDANGMPLPDGTRLHINVEESDTIDIDDDFTVDENGEGEFDISEVGDNATNINVTLEDTYDEDYMGNLTCGTFYVAWPMFTLIPEMIYIGHPNLVKIIAKDYTGQPIKGINVTLYNPMSTWGTPDPVETNADGEAEFSIEPEASGKLNVTIVRDISWPHGVLDWDIDDAVVTDTVVTVTSLQALKISVSKSPIFEDQH